MGQHINAAYDVDFNVSIKVGSAKNSFISSNLRNKSMG